MRHSATFSKTDGTEMAHQVERSNAQTSFTTDICQITVG
jgi:hypothetical protein